ncbi:hypothetical protein [Cochleicola gelatinilyticus]|uniref:BNR repeat protein n=1 Tax=Cochleicola gelatinilyticus TaxID=1763537 RepID=A0A167K989_9FLAO|nr:hypothetical protein [Cochleicola gelatinilyticus]OAB81522.1 hypothetical protein ULVI_01505 [Cochleicola gelatinilyticus]
MFLLLRTILLWSVVVFCVSCKQKNNKDSSVSSETTKVEFIENPSEENSALPRLFGSENGLFFSWVETKDTTDFLKYSVLKDASWESVETVTSGTDWFTNWADFPVIAENNGSILTNILQRSANGTYTYDIKLNLFSSETQRWNKNFILHKDGTKSEHGFVSMQPYGEESFFITWLDGRNTTGGHEGHDQHSSAGAMTLRSAVVHTDGSIANETELDSKVCDCCNTAAAITSKGPIVAYRDRSDEEIRDVSILRWENNKWTAPQTLGNDAWKIAGCPVNGPAISAIDASVAVAWFTGANELPKVYAAFSEDNGATFKNPIRMDSSEAVGRVDIALITATEAVVCWLETDGAQTYIMASKISDDGEKGEAIEIANIESGRSSGFPQMELYNDKLYFAWTEFSKEKQPFIKMSYLAIEQL